VNSTLFAHSFFRWILFDWPIFSRWRLRHGAWSTWSQRSGFSGSPKSRLAMHHAVHRILQAPSSCVLPTWEPCGLPLTVTHVLIW